MDNHKKIFSQLYDKYIDKIYRFVFLRVNSQEVAEDLTSETFLRGWRAFNGQEKKIDNPPAFLYQIARNLVIDFYREKGRTQVLSPEIVPIEDPNPGIEEKAILESDIDNIRMALVSLKEEYQNMIIWHYLDDLSVPEIAKIMEKPEGTIRVQLHRALKALKNEIKSV